MPRNFLGWAGTQKIGLLVVLLATCVYLWLAPSHLVNGDNAEFVAIAQHGGVAHPPGYPLYSLYLQAMSWLPGTPAHAAAVATALIGGAESLVLLGALQAWGASATASAITVALFAGSSLAILLNSHAEVFALNALFAAILMLICAPFSALRGNHRLWGLAIVLGFAFAHHHTIILLAPLLGVGIASAVQVARRPVPLLIKCCFLCLLITAVFYLTLLVPILPRSADSLVWGRADSIGWLWHHFLRSEYGTFSLSASGRPFEPLRQIAFLLSSTFMTWWLALPLAPVGILLGSRIAWKNANGVIDRSLWWPALILSWLASGPGLVSIFNISLLDPAGQIVVQRFHLLPIVLSAPPIALGFDGLMILIRRLRRSGLSLPGRGVGRIPRRLLIWGMIVYAFALSVVLSWPAIGVLRSASIEHYLKNSLAGLPPRSVLFIAGDTQTFGLWYLQKVEGCRRDVDVIAWPMLGRPWYRKRVQLSLGSDFRFSSHEITPFLQSLIGYAQAAGRDVFIDPLSKSDGLPVKALGGSRLVPSGTFMQVLPALVTGQADFDPVQSYRNNLGLYKDYFYNDAPSSSGDFWDVSVNQRYALIWSQVRANLLAARENKLAEHALRIYRYFMGSGGSGFPSS